MKSMHLLRGSAVLVAAFWLLPVFAQSAALDPGRIEQATGLKGTFNLSEGVFKVSLPRNDIQATVAGARMIPDLGLTAWAAFQRARDSGSGHQAMVMGDIVVL